MVKLRHVSLEILNPSWAEAQILAQVGVTKHLVVDLRLAPEADVDRARAQCVPLVVRPEFVDGPGHARELALELALARAPAPVLRG